MEIIDYTSSRAGIIEIHLNFGERLFCLKMLFFQDALDVLKISLMFEFYFKDFHDVLESATCC